LAILTWKGFFPAPTSKVYDFLRTLALTGDNSARNTLSYFEVASAALTIPTATESVDNIAGGSDICKDSEFAKAISVHNSLYRRLTTMRGAPNLVHDLLGMRNSFSPKSLYDMIPDDTAVLVYGRDFLRHCVWLLDRNGIREFAAILASDELINLQLSRLHLSHGISVRQSSRMPISKDSSHQINKRRVSRGEGAGSPDVPPGKNDEIFPLSKLLLPEMVGKKAATYNHLIVVPYGTIGTVPFSVLAPSEKGVPLVLTSSVSIAPSILDLLASGYPEHNGEGYLRIRPGCKAPKNPIDIKDIETNQALVVGDPDFSSGDPDFEMPQLPGAREEAIDVARNLGTRPYLGSEATPANVRSLAGNAKLLYFATHGFSYSRRGLSGFLALAGGRLTASEIQQMCLERTKLVVLSACQTGLGQAVDGGVIGLARAFQIAGAPSVVMSLWKVNDHATNLLMSKFMSEIAKGIRPHTALRRAMLESRNVYNEPRMWAGFTVLTETLN
jgi:hypothetical protein